MNQLPINHVIHLQGILVVIISDSGPQVTLRVWKEFCIAIWPNVRLSSGFQLQTNGQIERANQEQEAAFGVWYQPTSINHCNRSHPIWGISWWLPTLVAVWTRWAYNTIFVAVSKLQWSILHLGHYQLCFYPLFSAYHNCSKSTPMTHPGQKEPKTSKELQTLAQLRTEFIIQQ